MKGNSLDKKKKKKKRKKKKKKKEKERLNFEYWPIFKLPRKARLL
jgi:hypothetical protein